MSVSNVYGRSDFWADLIVIGLILGGGCIGAESAKAQASNDDVGARPGGGVVTSPVVVPQPYPAEHMLPDVGGMRATLDDLGVNVTLDYWGEAAGNVSGGLKQGADYAGQLGLGVDLNLDKILGASGLSFHSTVVQRHGRNHAADDLGDKYFSDTQIYGAGGDVAAHMVYFYLEQKWLDDRINAVAGRYTVGADFGASSLNCSFMALTVCGNPRLMPLQQGFSSWPLTDWGGRVRVRPTQDTYVMGGLFESSTEAGGKAGFHWGLDDATGAVIPLEVGYEPSFGSNALTGHYKVGGFYDTSDFPDYYYDVDGNLAPLTGLPGKTHSGRATVYALFDQMLLRNGPWADDGLNLLAGYLHSDPATAPIEDEAYVGFVDRGINPLRPRDTAAVMVTHFWYSKNLADAEKLENIIAGTPDNSPYVSQRQIVVETNYNFHFRGVDIAPDLQYIIRPNGASKIQDALVLGINTHFVF